MKTTELRIGNLLIDSLTNSLLKVSDISETGFISTIIDRSKFPLPDGWKATPIPLTEELLLKFGFEKFLGKMFSEHIVLIPCDDYFITLIGDKIMKIKYVHKLQNLYFALTGKELEVVNA